MALAQDTIALLEKITLDGSWETYTLTDPTIRSILIMLVKGTDGVLGTDDIDYTTIKKVGLAIGADTGIDGLIRPIQYITFDFNFKNEFNPNADETSASYRFNFPPEVFYIRVDYIHTIDNSVYTVNNKLEDGSDLEINIAININEQTTPSGD